jgi:hypothetical protein
VGYQLFPFPQRLDLSIGVAGIVGVSSLESLLSLALHHLRVIGHPQRDPERVRRVCIYPISDWVFLLIHVSAKSILAGVDVADGGHTPLDTRDSSDFSCRDRLSLQYASTAYTGRLLSTTESDDGFCVPTTVGVHIFFVLS